jgi:hypothetical protein
LGSLTHIPLDGIGSARSPLNGSFQAPFPWMREKAGGKPVKKAGKQV